MVQFYTSSGNEIELRYSNQLLNAGEKLVGFYKIGELWKSKNYQIRRDAIQCGKSDKKREITALTVAYTED